MYTPVLVIRCRGGPDEREKSLFGQAAKRCLCSYDISIYDIQDYDIYLASFGMLNIEFDSTIANTNVIHCKRTGQCMSVIQSGLYYKLYGGRILITDKSFQKL